MRCIRNGIDTAWDIFRHVSFQPIGTCPYDIRYFFILGLKMSDAI